MSYVPPHLRNAKKADVKPAVKKADVKPKVNDFPELVKVVAPPKPAMDFSKLVADKTFIDVSILRSANNDNYIMHMYYTGLVTLEFSDGFMKIL